MAEFPALPLWTDAWVADTKHLNRCERGTYHDLLVLMWRTPGCRVPNDLDWLGKRLGMTPDEVSKELVPLLTEFCISSGNYLTQKRLSAEYLYVQTKTRRRSDAAKLRWDKKNRPYNADAPTPTPTPTPLRGRGPDGNSVSETESAHAPTRKAASGQPRKEARRSPRAPMPETWAPSEAGLQYATDAGIARDRIPYLSRRCRDYHIRNGTMIAGERGLAATWRTWCDHEVKFTAEKNGTGFEFEQPLEQQRAQAEQELRKIREERYARSNEVGGILARGQSFRKN
jgi:uncharacterized protein YdaU (DUF1376 family)